MLQHQAGLSTVNIELAAALMQFLRFNSSKVNILQRRLK
jgi:hypothetical protein